MKKIVLPKKKQVAQLSSNIDKAIFMKANKLRKADGIKWPVLLESLLTYWMENKWDNVAHIVHVKLY